MDDYDAAARRGLSVDIDDEAIEIGGAALILAAGLVAAFGILLWLALRSEKTEKAPAAPAPVTETPAPAAPAPEPPGGSGGESSSEGSGESAS